MDRKTLNERATSNVLAWSTYGANVEPLTDEEEGGADADEPPDRDVPSSPFTNNFKRTTVSKKVTTEPGLSLLTKALQSHSEEETEHQAALNASKRRRSINSNISFASTTELTSDTGITTPARTSSPSPRRLPAVAFAPIPTEAPRKLSPKRDGAPRSPSKATRIAGTAGPCKDPAIQALEKKRCISFACAAQPTKEALATLAAAASKPATAAPTPAAPTPAVAEPVKRPCIKFACPTRPTTTQSTPPKQQTIPAQKSPATGAHLSSKERSPSAIRKLRSPSTNPRRPGTPRRQSSNSPVQVRTKKYLSADSSDLQNESSRFHVFASDEPQEDDWIRQDQSATTRRKLTIGDTLQVENAIRRLGQEAEEEAEQEEQDEEEGEEDPNAEDDPDDDEEEDVEDELDDQFSGYDSDDDASDGYKTDTEVGFADSDDEDDDLLLWTTGQVAQLGISGDTPMMRRQSLGGHQSDSSTSTCSGRRPRVTQARSRGMAEQKLRPGTPDLPDSTDFVCGTLDEDRPLEEAYISCIAARKREKLHPIPQDIDPSFPTSEPEDEQEEGTYKPAAHDSDEAVWLHGEIEDLHHDNQDRADRRKKKGDKSPRRYHSPPPKGRGRSPRRPFDHHSPKHGKSPMPPRATTAMMMMTMTSPPPPAASPVGEQSVAFKSLAFRPGLMVTKSLPRAPALFPQHMKSRSGRSRAGTLNKGARQQHVRGAIDIVKGLEQKRQRRKEKFYQKYCNRARKGQIPERKPQPGRGAERMREIGLLMAGKIGQGNYVLSI